MDIELTLLEAIRSQIGKLRFEMWFGTSPKIVLKNSCLQVHAVNHFSAEWIRGQFQPLIQKACLSVLGKKMPLEILDAEDGCDGNDRENKPPFPCETEFSVPKSAKSKPPRLKHKSPVVLRESIKRPSALPLSSVLKSSALKSSVSKSAKLPETSKSPETKRSRKGSQSPSSQKFSSSAPKLPVVCKQGLVVYQQGEAPAKQSRKNIKPNIKPAVTEKQPALVFPSKNDRPEVVLQQTLENFVEGLSNRLVVRAVDLAVRYPGKITPIYIYGPTSVGKTHLLDAIKNQVRRNPRSKPSLYLTAEQFTTAFIEGLRQGMPLFRNKFRDISTLLIDDIHFFEGKDSTQNEFFRTIETLKKQGVQIVLTGNRSLTDLQGVLKPEIITRLEAGMQCEIQTPERETLLKIFQQMVAARKLAISEEVCRFVVSRLTTHARQLSGALNRLHAVLLTTGSPITVSVAAETLGDLIRNNSRPVKLQDIEKAVCETFQIGSHSLQSKSRSKTVSHPRMLAMWLARKHTRSALSEIGKYFGDRSHSTVVSAQKKVDQWIKENIEMSTTEISASIMEIVQKVERTMQSG